MQMCIKSYFIRFKLDTTFHNTTHQSHLFFSFVSCIVQAFKEIYQYYLQRGFHITMVHADGEFAPLKVLIESLPGGPMVNLASPNEHIPKIE
jgi:predicted transcriptional regulator